MPLKQTRLDSSEHLPATNSEKVDYEGLSDVSSQSKQEPHHQSTPELPKEWAPRDVFDLLQGTSPYLPDSTGWYSIHHHPGENLAQAATSTEHQQAVKDDVTLHLNRLGIEQAATLHHARKPYSEEKVLPWFFGRTAREVLDNKLTHEQLNVSPERFNQIHDQIQIALDKSLTKNPDTKSSWEENKWRRYHFWANDELKETLDPEAYEALWSYTRPLKFQTNDDLIEARRQYEAAVAEVGEVKPSRETSNPALFGSEIDVTIKLDESGGITTELLPPLKELFEDPKMNLDYLVLAMHPRSVGVPKEVLNDPDKLTYSHLKLFKQLRDNLNELAKDNPKLKNLPIIWGHPFWQSPNAENHYFGMPGFAEMSEEQQRMLVQSAVDNNITIEINLVDHYLYTHEAQGGPRRRTIDELKNPEEIEGRIPALRSPFFDYIVKLNANVSLDTDLHVQDWMGWLNRSTETYQKALTDTKQLLQEINDHGITTEKQAHLEQLEKVTQNKQFQDISSAVGQLDKISDLLKPENGTKYKELPYAFRAAAFRFIKVGKYILNKGLKPSQIINLKHWETSKSEST